MLIVFDLDDTICDSIGRKMVWQGLKRRQSLAGNIKVGLYALREDIILTDPLESETAIFKYWLEKVYYQLSEEEQHQLVDRSKTTPYSGIEDTLNNFSQAYKTIISRNIFPVVNWAQKELNLNSGQARVYNKPGQVHSLVLWGQRNKVLVFGDSPLDFEMVDSVRRLGVQTDVVSVASSVKKSVRKYRGQATIHIPRDYRGLNELMKG